MPNIHPYFAEEGNCFANRVETTIFYSPIWIDEDDPDDLKKFHQISLERAQEIINEYKKKYNII